MEHHRDDFCCEWEIRMSKIVPLFWPITFSLLNTQHFPACHAVKAGWVMKPIYNSGLLKSGRMWCGFVRTAILEKGKYVADF